MAIPVVPPLGCATLKDIVFTWKCFACACCATVQILFKANSGLLCFDFLANVNVSSHIHVRYMSSAVGLSVCNIHAPYLGY